MFWFIIKVFVVAMAFFSRNAFKVNPLECVLMNNQERKIRTKIVDINNNEHSFYPFSISINKCSGSCKNTNESYTTLCVPHVVRNINAKIFNLMSKTNETRHGMA